jgi:hypothetical protein
MKLYGKKSIANILGIILNIILVVGIIITTMVYYNTFFANRGTLDETNNFVIGLLMTIGIVCIFLIVFHLKSIVGTLVTGNPFVMKNIKSLNKIAIECFIISGCYLLNFLVNIGKSTYKFIYVDNKGIHTDTELIIFFLAGGFILILSAVIKEALKYKEENEYTI